VLTEQAQAVYDFKSSDDVVRMTQGTFGEGLFGSLFATQSKRDDRPHSDIGQRVV